jgi:hypothetical protein
MEKYRNQILLMFILTAFFGCQVNVGNKKINELNDTSILYKVFIPLNILKGSLEDRRNWFVNALKLPQLKNNYKGEQIRIYEENMLGNGQIIILKDSLDIWSAKLIKYKTIRDSSKGKAPFYSMKWLNYRTIILKNPSCGWKVFIDSLNKLNVSIIKLQYPLQRYHDTEWLIVSTEYAADRKYFYNEFSDPYRNNSAISKNIVIILEYLKKQFKIGNID